MSPRLHFEFPPSVPDVTDLVRDSKCAQIAAAAVNQLFVFDLNENQLLWKKRFETEIRGLRFSRKGECLALLAGFGNAPNELKMFARNGVPTASTLIVLDDYRIYPDYVFGLDGNRNWSRAPLGDDPNYEILGHFDDAAQKFLEYSSIHDTVICAQENQIVLCDLISDETRRLLVPAGEVFDVVMSDCQSLALIQTDIGCFVTSFPELGKLVELQNSRAWRFAKSVEFCKSTETVMLSSSTSNYVGLIEYDIDSGLAADRTLPAVGKEFFVLKALANSIVMIRLGNTRGEQFDILVETQL